MAARDGLTGRSKFDGFAIPLPIEIIPREHLLDLLADLQFSLSEAVELVEDERAGEQLRTMKLPLQHLYEEVNAVMKTVPGS